MVNKSFNHVKTIDYYNLKHMNMYLIKHGNKITEVMSIGTIKDSNYNIFLNELENVVHLYNNELDIWKYKVDRDVHQHYIESKILQNINGPLIFTMKDIDEMVKKFGYTLQVEHIIQNKH
jgi:flagellar biosynthesis chaperone FliJ